jgi:hypothetical protein
MLSDRRRVLPSLEAPSSFTAAFIIAALAVVS